MRSISAFFLFSALSVVACDSGGGPPAATGGSGPSDTPTGGVAGTGGAPVASGGSSAGGTTGGQPAGADGGQAGAGGSGGGSGGSGGGSSGSGGSPASGGAPPALIISSDTSSIEFTPALIAAEDFYPGQATVQSGGIVGLLTDDNVDLGTNAETQTLKQSVTYPNLRIIFTVTETFYRIVANRLADGGIEELADLEGKRIASINSTSAEYFVDKYLGTVGVTDYTIVAGNICMAAPCGAGTLPALIGSGDADAIALWEPSTELGKELLGDDAIVFQDRSLYREIVNLHTTTEKLADPEKRRGIVEFVRALAQAQQVYRENPASVWPRIVDAIGIEQPVLEAVWEDEQFLGTLVPDILDVLEEEEPWIAAQTGRAPRTRAELETIIDTSVLEEALGTP